MGTKSSKLRGNAASHILNYAFENYKIYQFTRENNSVPFELNIKGGTQQHVSLKTDKVVSILLNKAERKRLKIYPKIPKILPAPLRVGEKVGSLEYWLDKKILKSVELKPKIDIQRVGIFSELTNVFTNLSDIN